MKVKLGYPNKVSDSDLVAVDIEIFNASSDQLHLPWVGDFATLSIATKDGVYVVTEQKDVAPAMEVLKGNMWALHQAKFDLSRLARWGKVPRVPILDTLIFNRCTSGGLYDRFSLADLARRELHLYLEKDPRELFGGDTVELTEEMLQYSALDAWITREIGLLYKDIDAPWYWQIDEPMIWAVMDMPAVRVDPEKWMEILKKEEAKFEKAKEELPFNARSWQQVKAYFAETFNITLPSTREEVLRLTAQMYPRTADIVDTILAVRGAGKNLSTYGENWLNMHLGKDNYVVADWRVVGTETGRMSAAKPNLQQIPIRKTPEYRTAFVASPGNKMLIVDVNQQEVRINVFFSRDENLMKILEEGGDTHLEVARLIFDDPSMEKDDARRKIGKEINLGISYGLTASGLSKNTGVSKNEAEIILDTYFEAFPGVKKMQDAHILAASRDGLIRTASGRPVWINPYDRWENNALNAPIQGSGGDQIKLASVLLHKKVKEMGLPYYMNLVIHDEQGLDVPEEQIDDQKKIVLEAWEKASEILFPSIPMKYDTVVGDTWGG